VRGLINMGSLALSVMWLIMNISRFIILGDLSERLL